MRAGWLLQELIETDISLYNHTPAHYSYERKRDFERTPGAYIRRLSAEKRAVLRQLTSAEIANVRW